MHCINFINRKENLHVYYETARKLRCDQRRGNDGGARDAYNSFLNVGKVFNAIARIFSGASSIINNVNVIYQSFLTLGDLLKSF